MGQDDWIERAFVTRLWMSVRNNASLEGNTLATLKKLVDCGCSFRQHDYFLELTLDVKQWLGKFRSRYHLKAPTLLKL